MKYTIILICVLLINPVLYAQDKEKDIHDLMVQGVKLHDEGKYEDAIKIYKQALKVDKESATILYEMSYSYFSANNYKEALKYSKMVLDKTTPDDLSSDRLGAYMVYAGALDMLDKPDESITVYNEALQYFPNQYLLYYNLGFTQYRIKQFDEAEENIINGILLNPNHASSHLVLSYIMKEKKRRVQSVLAMYYFLLLEPVSPRATTSYEELVADLGQGVDCEDEKTINVNILPFAEEDDFSPLDVMISMLAVNKFKTENKGKNPLDLFTETNKNMFSILNEISMDKSGFWWDFYVKKYTDIALFDNTEAFSYYISKSAYPELVEKWIENNPEKMTKFEDWAVISL